MEDEIIMDLGNEYGSILVEPVGRVSEEGGLQPAGLGEEAQKVLVDAKKLLRKPLVGLSNVFIAALPDLDTSANYQLDEFSVEFDIGMAVEVGADAGVVAKLVPNGTFKCTYTWKRKQEPPMPQGEVS